MNAFETEVAESLKADGWNVLRNGWPDFLCWREAPDGQLKALCVEVKQGSDKVSEAQITNHSILTGVGLPVYVLKSADVSTLDQCASLALYSAETLSKFAQGAARMEKTLLQAESSFQRQKEALLGHFEERFSEYSQRSEAIIRKFREISQLLNQAADTCARVSGDVGLKGGAQ